jgi:hypothetical protein
MAPTAYSLRGDYAGNGDFWSIAARTKGRLLGLLQ